MHVQITKADGTSEYFKVEKLRRSLRRAGASPEEVNNIVSQIMKEVFDGMHTQEIYRRAFTLLRESELPTAARYSLRRALFGLGPSGFPFEKFLARLFAADGYTVRTGVILQGKCAPHEIDIAAYREKDSFVGEAKFHSRPGVKTDLQVAMYSYARLIDLKNTRICNEAVCEINSFWLITNTKFTSTAEHYGECSGIKMLSWDYPKHNNLHDRIQRAQVYPITVVQSLTPAQIATLIERDAIICKDIIDNPGVLRHLHLSTSKHERVMSEVRRICSGTK